MTRDDFEFALGDLLERAKAEVVSLHGSSLTSDAIVDSMRDMFERCAKQALRRPDPIARSIILRKILRRFIPKPLRPWAKRLVFVVLGRGGR